MNKCLRNNWKIFNKIRMHPMGVETPSDLENINEWCERVWSHLENDDLKREAYYNVQGKRGFTISVWSDDKYVYIVQCVRSEFNTDDTFIFMKELNENNLADFKAIAKFLRYNIKNIIGNSKQAYTELDKLKTVQEIQSEIVKS